MTQQRVVVCRIGSTALNSETIICKLFYRINRFLPSSALLRRTIAMAFSLARNTAPNRHKTASLFIHNSSSFL